MYLSIGRASEFLGVSVSTFKRWEKKGFLTADFKTKGHHRRYYLDSLESKFDLNELTRDVIELMTVFSARLYGRKFHENRLKRVAA